MTAASAASLSDCCGSYFPEFHETGLAMIKAQGGIFGSVAAFEPLLTTLTPHPGRERKMAGAGWERGDRHVFVSGGVGVRNCREDLQAKESAPWRATGGGGRGVLLEGASPTKFRPKLWTPGDWNAFFGFGTNILVNMLTLTGLLRFVLKMPDPIMSSAASCPRWA